ncbi:phosphopantetheine-binding protein [Nonomuraea angiospora]|uniref:phosphopantetheine-binding protein n=1 Tax=Nonomuraea angiospora TaxID=46172 RepID=UPI0029A55312|nr:phosphopantetheine-binding protein [Nonomuraea angiospora]MDX3107366.1 phosphopantetheine-binding protein [Nonomuraea angiospora]
MWDNRFEEILRQHLPFLPADEKLREDVALLEFGLDSLGIVQLLGALEDTYGVRFRDDALTPETFQTPAVLWNTLNRISETAG